MKSVSSGTVTMSRRLEKAISELRKLQKLLVAGEGLDPRILADFRDALNRVRNTAWSAQQYVASRATDEDPAGVLSILAAERVRCAFQLCQTIQADLANNDVKFQAGPLIQLHLATQSLADQLADVVSKGAAGHRHPKSVAEEPPLLARSRRAAVKTTA